MERKLATEPDMVRRELVEFIYDWLGENVSETTITQAMKASNMTWKVMRRVAQ